MRNIGFVSQLSSYALQAVCDGLLAASRQREQTVVRLVDPRDIDHFAYCDAWVFAHSSAQSALEAVRVLARPMVARNRTFGGLRMPIVAIDEAGIGAVGARHLMQRSEMPPAYLHRQADYSYRRRLGFELACREERCEHLALDLPEPDIHGWEPVIVALESLLAEVPRGTGLMACNDGTAQAAWQAIRRLGRQVPQDHLLLGVDGGQQVDFEGGLSSVLLPYREQGSLLAEVIWRQFDGEHCSGLDLVVPPRGLREGASTATDHPQLLVNRALARWRQESGLSVEAMAGTLNCSRRTLERAFREQLGDSPAAINRRQRLELAARRLRSSDQTVASIALSHGFGTSAAFHRACLREYGQTPGQLRKQRD